MTPFEAIMGRFNPLQNAGAQTPVQMPGTPLNALQGAMQRAQQLAGSIRNPQALVQQYFPDAPNEVRGDPEQLLAWLQQSGRVNPQMVQMVRQMTGR